MGLVRFREPEPTLEVEGRDDVAGEDGLRDVGRVFRERLDDPVPVRLLEVVPGAGREVVRAVLHIDRQRMFPRRRDGRVEGTLRDDLEPRVLGGPTVLRIEERVLDVLNRGSDVGASPMVRYGRRG